MLRICTVGMFRQDCIEANTTSLTFTAGLESNTSYSALITAIGQGGSQTIPKQLIFTLKNSGECGRTGVRVTEGRRGGVEENGKEKQGG